MTRDFGERRHWMAGMLDEAFESGALAFSAPLLDAVEAAALDEFSGHVRSDQGVAYEIERKLGRGGMATVYLARDQKHDRGVAIKVLHAELTARVGAGRFVREIRLTARLQHPHVLGLLDSGVFDREARALAGRPYYVMPYVDGESLRARLARAGALPLADAIRVLREVADALSYAHEQGVIHRDIKPENILLTRGHAVVADFGIAKAVAAASGGSDRPEGASSKSPLGQPPIAVTQASTFVGTPGYMAPEQADEAHVDHRADLYAWGVVAYEVLTGQHPFAGRKGAAELLSAHVADVPRPIRDAASTVPAALGALVMHCLAKAPADRPASASEVVAALDVVGAAAPLGAPKRFAISRLAWVGSFSALGAVLALGAVVYWKSGRGETPCARYRPPSVATTPLAIIGTCDPARDVAAVQAAVARGGNVVLEGTFSFRQPPTKPIDAMLASARTPPAPRVAQVLVSKAVTISGLRDPDGGMPIIDGGTMPFYVDAPGAPVTIRGLRFVRPIRNAILVHAAHDVLLTANRIDGLEPFGGVGEAIAINTSGNYPAPNDSGRPGLVSGTLTIRLNDIDVTGGTRLDLELGVVVFSVGQSPRAEVTLDIESNNIRNTTSSAIMVRRANGRIRILGNTVTTSSEQNDYEAVRLVNTGSFVMAHNTINCGWATCVGIAVFSQYGEWPIRGAIIEDNQVNMLPSQSTAFADSSAAIEIKGFAHANVVQNNTIAGRARAALAIETYRLGHPEDNAFIDNHVEGFRASSASTLVGSGVLRTRLVHPGTVVDRGVSTTIQR